MNCEVLYVSGLESITFSKFPTPLTVPILRNKSICNICLYCNRYKHTSVKYM